MNNRPFARLIAGSFLLALAASLGAQQEIKVGLEAHWKLDENTGGIAADSSGAGRHLTYGSGGFAPVTSGDVPPNTFGDVASRLFSSTYPQKANGGPFFAAVKTNFSMAFWASPMIDRSLTTDGNTIANYRYVLSPRDDSGAYGAGDATAGVTVGTNGITVFEVGSAYATGVLAHNVSLTGWNHVVVTYAANKPTIYLNGVSVASNANAGPKAMHPASNLGIMEPSGYGPYGGGVDDVRIYSRVLDVAEISALAAGRDKADYGPPMPSVLSPGSPTKRSITVNWVAPASDNSGTPPADDKATTYDLRYTTAGPITTAADFNAAKPVLGLAAPKIIGQAESVTVGGLKPNTLYHFALKSADEQGQWSPISAPASATTLNDTVKPGTVTDLAIASVNGVSVQLRWTSTADDGVDPVSGAAASYDLRVSRTGPIANDAAFSAAEPVALGFTPNAVGTLEHATVGGLGQNGTYYFALKVGDYQPNWSLLSNSVSTGALLGGSEGVSSPCGGSAAGSLLLPGLALVAAAVLLRR